MDRRGARSDATVRGKPLILLNGDKVTLVALPDSFICTNICDSHPNNITGLMGNAVPSRAKPLKCRLAIHGVSAA